MFYTGMNEKERIRFVVKKKKNIFKLYLAFYGRIILSKINLKKCLSHKCS